VRAPLEKTKALFIAGLVLLCLGQLLGAVSMPINKSLWTPAYVLFMAGWSCLALAALYGLLDAMPKETVRQRALVLTQPLVVFGMNALFLFALSGLIAKMLGYIKAEQGQSLKAVLYGPIQSLGMTPQNASLLFAICFTLGLYGVAWGMWRKGWFIKV
jgi:predicted acyltransferase